MFSRTSEFGPRHHGLLSILTRQGAKGQSAFLQLFTPQHSNCDELAGAATDAFTRRGIQVQIRVRARVPVLLHASAVYPSRGAARQDTGAPGRLGLGGIGRGCLRTKGLRVSCRGDDMGNSCSGGLYTPGRTAVVRPGPAVDDAVKLKGSEVGDAKAAGAAPSSEVRDIYGMRVLSV